MANPPIGRSALHCRFGKKDVAKKSLTGAMVYVIFTQCRHTSAKAQS
jgi:hypothetical protein